MKWPEAYAVHNLEAGTALACFGVPAEIRAGISELHKDDPPPHPQSDGLVLHHEQTLTTKLTF